MLSSFIIQHKHRSELQDMIILLKTEIIFFIKKGNKNDFKNACTCKKQKKPQNEQYYDNNNSNYNKYKFKVIVKVKINKFFTLSTESDD